MKVIALFFSSTLLAASFYVSQSTALSIALCEEDTIECKVQNCESSNAVVQWDSMNTYPESDPKLKDCNLYEKKLRLEKREEYILVGFGALAGAGATATLFLITGIVKKYRRNKNK
ncbi:hypothetical protein BH23PAT2_BH23PAT2_08800 [soil metagenome]